MINKLWHKGNDLRRSSNRFPEKAIGISKKRTFYRLYKILKTKCLPNDWHSITSIFLQKKLSRELYLFWAIHRYSRRNIKASKNNIESYVQIKDMPNLLPLKEKKRIKSYGFVMKKIQEAQRIKKESIKSQGETEKIG